MRRTCWKVDPKNHPIYLLTSFFCLLHSASRSTLCTAMALVYQTSINFSRSSSRRGFMKIYYIRPFATGKSSYFALSLAEMGRRRGKELRKVGSAHKKRYRSSNLSKLFIILTLIKWIPEILYFITLWFIAYLVNVIFASRSSRCYPVYGCLSASDFLFARTPEHAMCEKVSLARMEMQISSRSSSVMGKRSSNRFLSPFLTWWAVIPVYCRGRRWKMLGKLESSELIWFLDYLQLLHWTHIGCQISNETSSICLLSGSINLVVLRKPKKNSFNFNFKFWKNQ